MVGFLNLGDSLHLWKPHLCVCGVRILPASRTTVRMKFMNSVCHLEPFPPYLALPSDPSEPLLLPGSGPRTWITPQLDMGQLSRGRSKASSQLRHRPAPVLRRRADALSVAPAAKLPTPGSFLSLGVPSTPGWDLHHLRTLWEGTSPL